MRVLIADDHELVRTAIARLIEAAPDMSVVGACADADEAVGVALRTRPDTMLMDIDMPGVSSFDAVRLVRSHAPMTRVLFLTAHPHDSYIERALEIEAQGFVTKNESPESMLDALRRVSTGRAYYSPEVEERLVVDDQGTRLAQPLGTRMSTLSSREMEVLQYIASGMSKKEIAGVMRLSVKTVDNHSTNLMGKLDIHDRVELAKYAIREGLISA